MWTLSAAMTQAAPSATDPNRVLNARAESVTRSRLIRRASPVRPENWEAWLDPRLNKADNIRGLMSPPLPGSLDIYPVTPRITT